MKWEFKSGLEEYLKKSSARLKTLEEIVAYYESNPDTMMKYGDGFLRGALDETTSPALAETDYHKALMEREKAIQTLQYEISGYDAVLMTGPTSIMHFCGLPTVTVAFDRKDANGVRQTVILYGMDEYRLYAAALAIEKMVNRQINF